MQRESVRARVGDVDDDAERAGEGERARRGERGDAGGERGAAGDADAGGRTGGRAGGEEGVLERDRDGVERDGADDDAGNARGVRVGDDVREVASGGAAAARGGAGEGVRGDREFERG